MRISDWSSDVCSSDLEPFYELQSFRTRRIRSAPGNHQTAEICRKWSNDAQRGSRSSFSGGSGSGLRPRSVRTLHCRRPDDDDAAKAADLLAEFTLYEFLS